VKKRQELKLDETKSFFSMVYLAEVNRRDRKTVHLSVNHTWKLYKMAYTTTRQSSV